MNREFLALLKRLFVIPTIPSDTDLPHLVRFITTSLAKFFRENAEVHAFLEALPKGPGTGCPDISVSDIIKYFLSRKGRARELNGIDKLRFLTELVQVVQTFYREIMVEAIDYIPDGTTEERIIIQSFPAQAAILDEMYLHFFNDVVVARQMLDDEAMEKRDNMVAAAIGTKYFYGVYDIVDGKVENARPWSVAYPEQISALCALLRDMANKCTTPELIEYLQTLVTAYENKDLEKSTDLWKEVDRKWLKLPANGSRISLTHGIEVYDDCTAVCPEWRLELAFPTDMEMVRKMQKIVIDRCEEFCMDRADIDELEKKYGIMTFSLFTHVGAGGWAMNFGMAGQVAPNWSDVRNEGVRVIIDYTNTEISMDYYSEMIKNHCHPNYAALLIPFITERFFLAETWGHELAHVAGVTEKFETEMNVGAQHLMEEAKASTFGFLVALDYFVGDKDIIKEALAYWIARGIRFMLNSERLDKTTGAYVRETMTMITIMLEVELLQVHPQGIIYVEEEDYLEDWVASVEGFVQDLLACYETLDADGVKKLRHIYCNGTGLLNLFGAFVNRPADFKIPQGE